MPVITSGAKFLKALQETGTGEAKLAIGMRVLADAAAANGGIPTDVSVDTMYAALLAGLPDEGPGIGTREKARQLWEAGEYVGAPRELTPLERLINPAPAQVQKPKTAAMDHAEALRALREEVAARDAAHARELADLRAELELQKEAAAAKATQQETQS